MDSNGMTNFPDEHDASVKSYFFTGDSSGRTNIKGAIAERGLIMGFGMIVALFMVGFALKIWSQQETIWDVSLIFALLILLLSAWHYLGLVVEINLTSQHLSLRRLVNFRSIPFEKISRVELCSLTTMGVSYVWIMGHSHFPLAVFPLLSGYPPETWKELIRLVEDLKQRVPVKHTM